MYFCYIYFVYILLGGGGDYAYIRYQEWSKGRFNYWILKILNTD